MAEYFKEMKITMEVDTNKRTLRAERTVTEPEEVGAAVEEMLAELATS